MNYLSENGVDVDEYRPVIHSIIFRINKKGGVFVTKHLCDYLILNKSNLGEYGSFHQHKELLRVKGKKK